VGRPFEDAAAPPTESALKATVGPSFARYQAIVGLAAAYSQEWNFSKASGWMLKIHDRKKALLYLIPLSGSFKISMAIRESEREALLADSNLAVLYGKLASAKKFSEGFSIQFDINDAIDFAPVESLISKLIAARR
jgi:hypothetical protein